MTIREAISENPINQDESVTAYSKRIASISGHTWDSVRSKIKKDKARKMKTVARTLDANGNVISTVQKLQQNVLHEYNMPIVRVSTNTTTGQQWVIKQANSQPSIDIKGMIYDAIEKLDIHSIEFKRSKKFNPHKLTNFITDVHGGMDPSDGFLNYEWNAKILKERFETNLNHVVQKTDLYGRFEVIKLVDLGDTLDGYEGLTTRGGHDLPQNMTSAQQFQLCLEVYVQYVRHIVELDLCNELHIIRVENDNHGGSFGQALGIAIEGVLKAMFPKYNIVFKRQSKFIDFEVYGDHVSVYTHGKDKRFMKTGLPYEMNSTVSNYLLGIFKKWGILDKKINVYKGDLHMLGMSKNTFFRYYNFMAFSPPSGWANHNYGVSDSGYSIHIVGKDKRSVNVEDMEF
jgi:hypothetical protein